MTLIYALLELMQNMEVQLTTATSGTTPWLNGNYTMSMNIIFEIHGCWVGNIFCTELVKGYKLLLYIGDSGYGQQPYLFVPIANTTSEPERKYNIAHQKARHRVERAIGVLKCRFRCLLRQRSLVYSPSSAGIFFFLTSLLKHVSH